MNVTQSSNSFEKIPDDPLLEIFSKVGNPNQLVQVCKKWQQVIEKTINNIASLTAPSANKDVAKSVLKVFPKLPLEAQKLSFQEQVKYILEMRKEFEENYLAIQEKLEFPELHDLNAPQQNAEICFKLYEELLRNFGNIDLDNIDFKNIDIITKPLSVFILFHILFNVDVIKLECSLVDKAYYKSEYLLYTICSAAKYLSRSPLDFKTLDLHLIEQKKISDPDIFTNNDVESVKSATYPSDAWNRIALKQCISEREANLIYAQIFFPSVSSHQHFDDRANFNKYLESAPERVLEFIDEGIQKIIPALPEKTRAYFRSRIDTGDLFRIFLNHYKESAFLQDVKDAFWKLNNNAPTEELRISEEKYNDILKSFEK